MLAAYREMEESVSFSRPEAPGIVRPAYMGLITQLDDWLGRLFAHMERAGRLDDTLIVFTADHGDFLGDHWLGEKEMFYEEAQRVPFIVVDPDPDADLTRGTVDERFVEAIDVVPTILETLGLPPQDHLVEGRSLLPLLRRIHLDTWRDAVFSELDYSFREARTILGRKPRRMPRHHGAHRPLEICLVARLPADAVRPRQRSQGAPRSRRRPDLRADLPRDGGAAERLGQGAQDRVTVDDAYVAARTAKHRQHGIFFGQW